MLELPLLYTMLHYTTSLRETERERQREKTTSALYVTREKACIVIGLLFYIQPNTPTHTERQRQRETCSVSKPMCV